MTTRRLLGIATGMITAALWMTPALAGEADTSAKATGGRLSSGSAAATAHYEGDVGLARTRTATGKINAARAVAVGVDRDGLSLSVSTAIAGKKGPAVATTFNVSIGKDGDVSHSVGTVVSAGGLKRTAEVSGGTAAGSHGATSLAKATGKTVFGGVVKAHTESDSTRARKPVVRVVRR